MEATVKPTNKVGVRHVQIFLMFITGMISFGLNTCMSVAIVAMTDVKSNNTETQDIQTFGWDSMSIYLILSSLIWGTVIAQIPFGLVIMKYSAQKVITGCIFTCGIAYLLIPIFAKNIGWAGVLGLTTIVGFGLASIEPCQQSLLSRWAPPSERARFSSFVFSGGNLGNAFSMIFAGMLGGSRFGWPSIFYTFGGIATFWAILFYFVAANAPSEHSLISNEEKRYIMSSLDSLNQENEIKDLKFPWKAVIKSLPVWAFAMCVCGDVWNLHMMMSQLPMFMKKIFNFDIEKSGGISALPFLVKVLLAIPISWLSDFALKRGVSVSLVRKVANTVGMWGPGAALLSLCFVEPSNEVVIVLIFILAVGLNAGVLSGLLINALDLCPNYSGTLFSIVNTLGKVFGVFAPIVCGAVVTDQTSIAQWRIIFYISAGMYIFPNFLFLIFGKAEKQQWNEPTDSKNIDMVAKHWDYKTSVLPYSSDTKV